jgi:hypothetical protein
MAMTAAQHMPNTGNPTRRHRGHLQVPELLGDALVLVRQLAVLLLEARRRRRVPAVLAETRAPSGRLRRALGRGTEASPGGGRLARAAARGARRERAAGDGAGVAP